MMYPQTSPCQHHECKHGVCFVPNPLSSEYICKCVPGYSGKRCEYLTSISFVQNNSFVEMEPLRTKPEANVTIIFSSSQQNGVSCLEYTLLRVFFHSLFECAFIFIQIQCFLCLFVWVMFFLHINWLFFLLQTLKIYFLKIILLIEYLLQVLLYDGQVEHLAVELFNGRVRVSYDVGNHPVSTMYSFEVWFLFFLNQVKTENFYDLFVFKIRNIKKMIKTNFIFNISDGGRWKISHGRVACNQKELYVTCWSWNSTINNKRG